MTVLYAQFAVRTAVGQVVASGTVLVPADGAVGQDAYEGAMRLAQAVELALLNLGGVGDGLRAGSPDLEPRQPVLL